MKSLLHAKISAHKFGGIWQDYIKIHQFFDQTKNHLPDARHRLILHNSFGIDLCEQIFGVAITNSAGKEVSVKGIAEQHVLDDLGTIPTLSELFTDIPIPANVQGGKTLTKIKAGNYVIVDQQID